MATAAISAGASVAGVLQAFMNSGYSAKGYVEIQNYTTQQLNYRDSRLYAGEFGHPPCDVHPGQREAFYAHKYSGSLFGTAGMATWDIGETGKVLAIMWDIRLMGDPNTLTLGIGDSSFKIPIGEYHEAAEHHLRDTVKVLTGKHHFKSKKFYEGAPVVEYATGKFKLKGQMGTDSSPKIIISLYPTK